MRLLLERKRDGRSYRLLQARSVGELQELNAIDGGFAALLAAPEWKADRDRWRSALQDLLEKGLRYCCVWADGQAEELHDLVDRLAIDGGFEDGKSVIMTTWHDRESLPKAVWYLVNCAEPTESYSSTCKQWICLSVGDDALAHTALRAMQTLFPQS